ncbi:hypothetical protein QA649_39705 [Bradyrhizobium sp. CB1717]|uniref:hypothetical protein n=1 Tax=Bradyrhizobium sp. CB1717 TaxID=3039154 RepID=UPI0024B19600|nr:hypothetical protein [Bradyrhizobium sp. CB1717]WFU24060.1 hypothetical protein QA649_39705 [Bradyrhizobium sp. CB1717]
MTTTNVDISTKDDAKALVQTFVDQDEQVAKIEITVTNGVFAGAVTFNDPPTPEAVGDGTMDTAKADAAKAIDDGKSKITIERSDAGKWTVTAT